MPRVPHAPGLRVRMLNRLWEANGLGVKKAVRSENSTVYIFSGSKVVAEYENAPFASRPRCRDGAAPGSPSREYIYSGAALLAKVDSTGTHYYHQDHLSNRMVTTSAGADYAEMGTFPYGESWYNTSGDKLQFTTYETDSESGNNYAQARSYVNRLARFSSLDSLAGSTSDPQSLNRYSYVRNMPVTATDPTGMWMLPPSDPCDARMTLPKRDGAGEYARAGHSTDDAEPDLGLESQDTGAGGCTGDRGGSGGVAPILLTGGCADLYIDGGYAGTNCVTGGGPTGSGGGGGGQAAPGYAGGPAGPICGSVIGASSAVCSPPPPPCISTDSLNLFQKMQLGLAQLNAAMTGWTFGFGAGIDAGAGLGPKASPGWGGAGGSASTLIVADATGAAGILNSFSGGFASGKMSTGGSYSGWGLAAGPTFLVSPFPISTIKGGSGVASGAVGNGVLAMGGSISTSGAATITMGTGGGAEAGVSLQVGPSSFTPFCK